MPSAAIVSLARCFLISAMLVGSIAPLSAQSKEYIRLGGRVIAVESPIEMTVQSPARTTIGPGETAQFTALINGQTSTAVTWSVSDSGAGAFSQTTNGQFQAASVTGTRSVTVTATSTYDSTKTATASLTVKPLLGHTTRSFSGDGGTDGIDVTKDGNWSVVPTESCTWVHFSSTNFSGNSNVTYTVDPFPGGTLARSATFKIASGTPNFTVSQEPGTAVITIAPSSRDVDAGGTGIQGQSVTVSAPVGTAWSVVQPAFSWISVVSPTPGSTNSGPGSVVYTVSANPEVNTRVGTLTIAGLTHTINQAGRSPYVTTDAPSTIDYQAHTYNVTVFAPVGASWSASCAGCSNWLTLSSPATGTGQGGFSFTVTSNMGGQARQGTITISGLSTALSLTVSQAGNVLVRPAVAYLGEGQTYAFNSYLTSPTTPDTNQSTWTVESGDGSFRPFPPADSRGIYDAPTIINTQHTSTLKAQNGSVSGTAQVVLTPNFIPSVLQSTPTSAAPAPGASQQFEFMVNAPLNPDLVDRVGIVEYLFSTGPGSIAGSCHVKWYSPFANAYGVLQLHNDDATAYLTSVGNADISNSQCTVKVSATTYSRNPSTSYHYLTIQFKPSFAGNRNLYMTVYPRWGAMILPQTMVGTLTVPDFQPPSVAIDQPSAGATVAGSVTISGWALDNTAQVENSITAVEVYLDGVQPANKLGNASYGSSRSDICTSYPNRAGCPNVGFSYVWDSSGVSPGPHTIRVIATDNDAGGGKHSEASASVTVGRAVTVATSPAGLPITVDGTPYTAPQTFAWVVGSTHTIAAANQQIGDILYTFQSWSDGGSATHTVTTPSAAQTLTAAFSAPSLPLDQYVTNVTLTSGTSTYPARNSVVAETAVTISGSASVVFKAGNYILLKPGFQATAGTAGTTFKASIDPSLQ